jgi:hypothetical protein
MRISFFIGAVKSAIAVVARPIPTLDVSVQSNDLFELVEGLEGVDGFVYDEVDLVVMSEAGDAVGCLGESQLQYLPSQSSQTQLLNQV